MELLWGKRGATAAPSVEKPTAITASSAHWAKTGTPGRACWLRTNRSSPAAARARETAHMHHDSQAALLGLLPLRWRPRSNRGVSLLLRGPARYQYHEGRASLENDGFRRKPTQVGVGRFQLPWTGGSIASGPSVNRPQPEGFRCDRAKPIIGCRGAHRVSVSGWVSGICVRVPGQGPKPPRARDRRATGGRVANIRKSGDARPPAPGHNRPRGA